MASSPSTSSSTVLATPPDLHMEGIPTATLDTADIGHAMAARLTIALLGHMLYMKGQVPFPVQSIARMSQHEAVEGPVKPRIAARMAKKRTDFLQSYDDLTSHLHSTFVAVSTALALNDARYPLVSLPLSVSPTRPPATVYVMFMLGSSPSSAKTRLLLELDGLRVEKFGEQEYLHRRSTDDSSEDEDHASNGSVHDNESHSCTTATDADDAPALSLNLRRPESPSPSPAHVALTSPLMRVASPASTSCTSRLESPPPSPSSIDSYSDIEEPTDSYARHVHSVNVLAPGPRAEEAAIRTGERLLSRALFAAGEALGFGDEISPTQAHIFIRAPRRLSHPTWIPRESLSTMLDRHVQRYLDTEQCQVRSRDWQRKHAFGTGVRTVGVKVKCRLAETSHEDVGGCDNDRSGGGGDDKDNGHSDDEDNGHNDNDDELIWWSWDGKLVGFTD